MKTLIVLLGCVSGLDQYLAHAGEKHLEHILTNTVVAPLKSQALSHDYGSSA